MSITLADLFEESSSNKVVSGLTIDSRQVRPGNVFFSLNAEYECSSIYIKEAINRGAIAVVSEENLEAHGLVESSIELILVKELHKKLSVIAGRFYDNPSQSLALIGITGTNGKTTTSQLLAQALEVLGKKCGLIGTLGYGFYNELTPDLNTTPEAIRTQKILAQLATLNADTVAMEVSSHGLHQGRVAGLSFNTAVFTNLSRDHLDYHGSMPAYAAVKAQLFQRAELENRIINIDDSWGAQWAKQPTHCKQVTYSLRNNEADVFCSSFSFDSSGIQASIVTPVGAGVLNSKLLGEYNLSNLLAVISVLICMGVSLEDSLLALKEVDSPTGRMQKISNKSNNNPLVVVDYAHTPDALIQLLSALRNHTKGRLLCLFGCGGDRDRGKRALMACACEELADYILVTDDNPRGESSEQIFNDIREGFTQLQRVDFIPGRARAISTLIALAEKEDVVVLAGKGHETYQEINGVRHSFSDQLEAEKALDSWSKSHD